MPATVAPPSSRRSTSISSASTHSPSSSISRGATARSTANPRQSSVLSPASRRGSLKASTPPPINGDTRESLSASLRQETEAKEQLLLQLQNKEHTITSLTGDNEYLSSALNSAESRLADLYAEQNRMEEEMAARIEVAEKLRTQVRDLEKEKRDLQRRYNEQTVTFEAERQSFYDSELHLKSRIQTLTHARKIPPVPRSPSIAEPLEEEEEEVEPSQSVSPSLDKEDLDAEPAEMTALRLELSTLVTSHSSLQNTVTLLQVQLTDLKRVNHTLQEENESYNILLREKTLSGQFDVMRQMAPGPGSTSSDDQDDDADSGSVSGSRSYLDTVNEHPDESLDPEYAYSMHGDSDGERLGDPSDSSDALASPRSRHGRRHGGSVSMSHSPKNRGESLADLPITGPGLDLAAELGRAENKDILEGRIDAPPTKKRGKKGSTESRHGLEPSNSTNEVDAMKSKIKSLEDANKALSLYASKIIDRIIAQEGFEHVLAIDYDSKKPLSSPSLAQPQDAKSKRRASMFVRPTPAAPSSPLPERLTTFDSPPNPSAGPQGTSAGHKRRSLSFDWRAFSLFGGERKPESSLRPLTLQPGAAIVTGTARKLDTEEDDEDRRERERLHATMKLMGIDKPMAAQPMQKSFTAPAQGTASPISPDGDSAASTPPTRFAFFRRNTATPDTSSVHSTETPLTQESLVHVEATNALAALDAREKQLELELSGGHSGGFTEITRKARRGRASGGGSGHSGSTVWSAGMSHDHGDD
ncbi:hypothetical protein K488DRAFT_45803 [Vararia minispora EC-137]|uniref:Uncharacterized protein n=1 Tax=Vararia minispora EC-137 TaxID=1314806 RepID=A0ACB8QQY4_9AGAM|nr:hypothetical protein K488DRAFT_45803 [Vararia minispora EC-137]